VARTRFHAVTPGVARSCRRDNFIPSGRVRVAERGRDPQRFAPRTPERLDAIAAALGLDADRQVLLMVGRQDRMKGHVRAIEAFTAVAATHPEAVLVLAGRAGSATAEIDAAIAASPARQRIMALGHRDDVADLLALATVVVCASFREGAAGALIEAMAAGTPIVTTRLAGLEGILVDGVNARVVEPGELAAAMSDVLDDPAAAQARAEVARREFAARFTLERAATALGEVYAWASR